VRFSRLPRGFRDARAWLAAMYLAIAVGTGFLPLAGDLHYEFSAVIAIAASLLTGIVVSLTPHDGDRRLSAGELWKFIRNGVLLALLPLPVALVRAFIGDGCGMLEGIAWYILLVPPAAAISAVLGGFARLPARRGWIRLGIFLLLWSASLLRGAWEGLAGPHIFYYSWQVGFFPGGSWDAELPITATLVIYRVAHLLVAALLALVIVEIGNTRRTGMPRRDGMALIAAGTIVAAGTVALVAHRPELGLTRTDHWLRAELGDSLHTRFTVIYYHAPSTDSLDLWRAANLADFHVAELARDLGIHETDIEPVEIYLYASPDEEKRLVGTGSAAFTKPWARKLNMSFTGIGSTLRHELAHVMLARYGNPLGISISQGLLEGSAMALENDYLWRELHEYARAMYAFGLAPPAEAIMSVGGFSSRRTSVSYVLAGSFSRWLIERYGMQRYLAAFPWADFEKAYGRSLHELSDEYRSFIDSLPPPPPSQEPTMRYLFGGGSFFFQKCLRRIGSLNGAGYDALAGERYEPALELFRSSLEEGISYGARTGVLLALSGLGRYGELLDSSRTYSADSAGYPLLPYLIERGDAMWALGDTPGAQKMYDSVLALDISQGLSLRAALRLRFMRADSALATVMQSWFTRPMKRMQRLTVIEQALAAADDPRIRPILALMRATLTAQELPLSTIDRLAIDLRATSPVPDAGHGLEEAPASLDRFIIPALASGLRPAARYAAAHDVPGAHAPELAAVMALPRRGFIPGSERYLHEQEEMEWRFERYLERFFIEPGRK